MMMMMMMMTTMTFHQKPTLTPAKTHTNTQTHTHTHLPPIAFNPLSELKLHLSSSLPQKQIYPCPNLTQIHDNTLMDLLPQVSTEDLDQGNLERWNLASINQAKGWMASLSCCCSCWLDVLLIRITRVGNTFWTPTKHTRERDRERERSEKGALKRNYIYNYMHSNYCNMFLLTFCAEKSQQPTKSASMTYQRCGPSLSPTLGHLFSLPTNWSNFNFFVTSLNKKNFKRNRYKEILNLTSKNLGPFWPTYPTLKKTSAVFLSDFQKKKSAKVPCIKMPVRSNCTYEAMGGFRSSIPF